MPEIGSTLRFHDHGELIAAVPHLLGFYPSRSLIVVGLTTSAQDTLVIATCLRTDLHDTDRPLVEFAPTIVDALRYSHLSHAVIVVVSGPDGPPPAIAPDEPDVRAVTAALEAGGIRPLHALWTHRIGAGEPWACYEPDRCAGLLPDPASSLLATHRIAGGHVTHPDRTAMADLLAPADSRTLARRAKRLARAQPLKDPARFFALFRVAICRVPRTEEEFLAVGHALTDPSVFLACLSLTHGPSAVLARPVWQVLTRQLPAPHRAHAAVLYGLTSYLDGNGALAGIAFDLALEADPTNPFATLLATALAAGMTPTELRELVAEAGRDGVAALGTRPSP